MDKLEVRVQDRAVGGKSAIRNLKDEGIIPGVLYNSNTSSKSNKSIPISIDKDEIRYIIKKYGEDVLLNVNFRGENLSARIQEVQRDPMNHDEIKHIDLMPMKKGDAPNYLH